MPRALLSVSDKTGLTDFARELAAQGWELVSTGGTAKALRDAGLPVTEAGDVTGVAEMLDGRVKTLHPAIHGAILARRDLPEHMQAIADAGITPIDLVAVNLYPFAATAARAGVTPEDVIEQIDIGGPSMLRSAAKNFAAVTVVVDPSDYPRVLAAIDDPRDAAKLRRELAEKVFAHTAAYDAAIAEWFGRSRGELFPERLTSSLERQQQLRYGENPGQRAAFYVERRGAGISALTQRGGKELSFNNLLDREGALFATDAFRGES
ncbi:MAG TPA: bifunctional phosphoribosylaminoimidazolecarboxamide formyltransferase/IMP cyclohydrolase, partial [Gemmatimonadaceae bacterium]|nr:bifunctional phosphoribosylaminoimidazolecarboxamide formyltransferase/IMP cyclohydrolase [Gemmatimonadaceae bacterium]